MVYKCQRGRQMCCGGDGGDGEGGGGVDVVARVDIFSSM